MADKIIRLHVVANSDTSSDLAAKLAVRDAVLRETGRAGRASDPKQAVAAQLPTLEAARSRGAAAAGAEDLARREALPPRAVPDAGI